jgi:malonyl CoA-acyl carrier protein transacylase
MIAVLGDSRVFQERSLAGVSDLVAVNYASHFVIAAPAANLATIESILQKSDLITHRLPVSLAFHSRWIDSARMPFESFMETVRCGTGKLPMLCCEQAGRAAHLSPRYFWNVARRPIRFKSTIELLEQEGHYRYIDAGPSGTLAGLLKYILPRNSRSTVASIMSPYDRDLQGLAAIMNRS